MGGGKMNGRLVGWGSGRFLSSSFSFNRESSSTSSSLKGIFGLRALQGQPQWNFAPFIFYSVVAACLRYVCTWTEEVLFLCANGIELLIKWVSWIHKANQSERQREVRICSLALQQLLRLIWQIQLLFVCCTNSSSVSSFCVSVCQRTTTTNQLTVRMNEENQQKRGKYFSTLFSLLILRRQVNFFTIPDTGNST